MQYTHCIYITPLMYVCLHELLHILCIYYRIYISHTDYIYSPPVCMYVRIYVYKFYSIYYYDYIYNIHTLYTHLYMPAYTHHHLPPSLHHSSPYLVGCLTKLANIRLGPVNGLRECIVVRLSSSNISPASQGIATEILSIISMASSIP